MINDDMAVLPDLLALLLVLLPFALLLAGMWLTTNWPDDE